jgi:redox-sensing transcriptional repressor
MKNIPSKIVERLCVYRQILLRLQKQDEEYIYSHQLAKMANASSAQVRRDLMMLNNVGTPQKGYNIEHFLNEIKKLIDTSVPQKAALIGFGNLGRAILCYFSKRRPNIVITSVFDADPEKIDRGSIHCGVFPPKDIEGKVTEEGISLGIITVPEKYAQGVADQLVSAGVKGIINFAPVRLDVPAGVYLEDVDITVAIEKTAYFAKMQD